MDENQGTQAQTTPEAVTEQTAPGAVTEQTTPEAVPEEWDDEAILPDESGTDEAEEPLEKLFADAGDDGGESLTPSGNTDAPEASGDGKPGPDGGETKPDGDGGQTPTPEPDYKALYENEMERQNAEKFRRVYQEQLTLSGNEAVARLVAMNETGGKSYPLEDAPEPAQTPSGHAGNDFRDALSELHSLYPDAAEMPQSVMEAYAGGKPLKEAYASYRAGKDAKTIASLRSEIEALKKTVSNRAAAPVKGVSGDKTEPVDAFMAAFDEEF